MKINVYTANKETTFFVHCDSYIKNTFGETFTKNIDFIKYKEVFPRYRSILVENLWFTYLKDLSFGKKIFEINDDIVNLYKNFEAVDLDFWKKVYEDFNTYEKFNIHVADKILLQYFFDLPFAV